MNTYTFIQFRKEMKLPDGIYNGRYNKEPAIIRIEYGIPSCVQFIGFMKRVNGEDEVRQSCIFEPGGILHSSVEILLPAQELKLQQ